VSFASGELVADEKPCTGVSGMLGVVDVLISKAVILDAGFDPDRESEPIVIAPLSAPGWPKKSSSSTSSGVSGIFNDTLLFPCARELIRGDDMGLSPDPDPEA
jgi:hypothetical protein